MAAHLHVPLQQPGPNAAQLALPSSAPGVHLSPPAQDDCVVRACTPSKLNYYSAFQLRLGVGDAVFCLPCRYVLKGRYNAGITILDIYMLQFGGEDI